MTCEEAVLLISGSLDRENTEQEEQQLQEHLEICPQCRETMQAFLEIHAGIAALRQEVPADLSKKVMHSIKAEKRAKIKRRNRWSVLAVAAALVLVIGLGDGSLPILNGQEETGSKMARLMEAPEEETVFGQMAKAETDPQLLAEERHSCVVVTYDLLQELEGCDWELLPGGGKLFALPSGDSAIKLSRSYELELYTAEQMLSNISYALLLP